MMCGWGERVPRACQEHCAPSSQAASSPSLADDPDAAYKLAFEQPDTEDGEAAKRRHLQRAFDGFCLRGDHRAASRAAQFLSRMAQDERDFEKALELAGTAHAHAKQSGDSIQRARSHALLAEIYDTLGMASAAQRNFMEAEELSAAAPDEAANILLKHGCFLLDQRKPETIERALRFFQEARTAVIEAQKQGRGARVKREHFAIALNMADALSQLGKLEEAQAELTLVADNELASDQLEYRSLVTGYIAARRGDVAAAARAFEAADASHRVDDYRWQMALELARALLVGGDLQRAEALLRRAVAIVDELRRSTAQLDLRPWILARRNDAHRELFELLVKQGRATEALAIAEALSAQTWLDAAIDVRLADKNDQDEALRAARLRVKLVGAAWPTPSVSAAPTTHEVLLYVDLGERIWRAHLRGGAVTFKELPADTSERIDKLAQDFENATARQAAGLALLPNDLSAGGGPLYIIAYGALADVPFAALETGGKFLIQSRDVARLPGLAALRCRPRRWSQEAIVLGDARKNLPFAAAEASRLARSLATEPHLGAAATEAALLRAKNARLLHVATHGLDGIDGRVLQLADRDVPAALILEKGVAPRLAVLSGCATAASDAPESWNGFPSALLAAGSQYVIATLRSIDDRPAARVVSAFYAQPEGSPVAQLAAAQRSLLGELPVREWSAFAAWGADECAADLAQLDPRPLPKQSP